jgi:hypothetical protein
MAPVEVPMPEVTHLPAVIPAAMPTPASIPMPTRGLPGPETAGLATQEAVAAPPHSAIPRTMAMLSEIEFLDD